MGKHSTDDVYDKVTDIEQKLDKGQPQQGANTAVTQQYLDKKIASLKTAIENAGKKDDEEKKRWQDLVKDWEPVKAFLEVLNGKDVVAKIILGLSAAAAAIGAIGLKFFDLEAAVKALTLAFTGRERQGIFMGRSRGTAQERQEQRRYFGVGENGLPGLQRPEPEAQQPNLPSVAEINRVKDAMNLLNAEVGTYREKVRGLATPRAMRQMASAAKKLESAAKNHQSVDTLAGSIRELNAEMRVLAGTAGS
ncbi:hypothetical protein [Streptomyces sp. NPDC048282]|uniref:hypothetical protein n=1 Tax=Streptomyces sp. NPDC048282 TaxID=3365528 RepID=UPI00372211F0